jgi:osmotically-inducible protein OsmY
MKELEGVSLTSMAMPSSVVDIFSKLAAVEGVDVSEIDVRVSCGEVTVEGVVKTEEERVLVEDIACNTPGVSDCQNNLRTA